MIRHCALFFFAPLLAAQSVDGIWKTQGYGLVYDIQGSTLKSYEVTTSTCVPAASAHRDTAATPGREATFRESKNDDPFFIRAGSDSNHKLLHVEGSASDMRIDRIPTLPEPCLHPTPNAPAANFDVFTHTWAEHYISFDLKHADWDRIVADNRAKVTPTTTPTQLFDIFVGMIKPFGDAHVSLSARSLKKDFGALRPGTNAVVKDVSGSGDLDDFAKSGVPKVFAPAAKAYLHTPLRSFCNGKLLFGHIDAATGYLRITAFGGYSKPDTYLAGLKALEDALDAIFSDANLKALVIDVRINFGGADPYGLEIASRLATAEYLAYTKYARVDPTGHDRWSAPDASIVRPSSRPGFHGPVVELTGPLTISAGETFTQAMMGRTPHITRIGENTQGVFSDVLERRLPNGWRFGLPNEIYRTPEGKAFDGPGIPPDIAIPVFTHDDLAAGKDPALAEALRILAK